MNILQLDANNFNQDLTISIKEDEKNVKIDYKQGTGCVVSLSNENRERRISEEKTSPSSFAASLFVLIGLATAIVIISGEFVEFLGILKCDR